MKLLSLLVTFAGLVSCQTTTATTSAAVATYTVNSSPGPGEYGNITAAIAALPADSQPKVIVVRAGTYTEQISITRNGKVTLIGDTSFPNDFTQNTVTVQFSNGQLTSAGKDESTPVIYAKKSNDNSGLAVYNINFNNTYPQTYNTAALAVDFYGQNIAAYGCSFIGYQDTLLANKGLQVFSNSYIEGSVDFIWGFSTAYFYQCYIAANTRGACIAAQSRANANVTGGYVFDSCVVTYTNTYGSSYNGTYLGRPYSNFSIAVYMNSYLDKHINSAGWSVWSSSSPQTSNVTFGEYNNTGPGSWQANTIRAPFATNFTAAQASAYQLSSWVGNTAWLDQTAFSYIPSYSLNGPPPSGPISPSPVPTSTVSTSTSATSTSTTVTTTSTSSSSTTSTSTSTPAPSSSSSSTTVSSTSTVSTSVAPTATNAHPNSGTIPPLGAVVVDGTGAHGGYTSLTAALASLPADSSNQTIFMYSGTYNEQAPGVNRPGPTRIVGYTLGNPGQSYQDNTVVLTWSRGLSVSPLPSGHSDAETSTFTATSNTVALYNIDIVNTDNLNGTVANYVTLAGSIYGSQVGFYGCSLIGWQDTLLTGTRTGYQYYESSYIEGAIDFIWGYSKAYFKGCTIAAKRSGSCITAQSRLNSAAIGGYIFDQCLFTAAPDSTVDLTNKVYLGRPYDSYATVVIKYSYIDSVINPSGWKIWSATSPNTDFITFAEYNNTGPSAWQYNVAARLAFGNCTLLTADTYTLDAVMNGTYWIDSTYWSSIVTPMPNYPGEGVPIVTVTALASNSTPTTTTLPANTVTSTSTVYFTTTGTSTVVASTSTVTIVIQSATSVVNTVIGTPILSTTFTTATATRTATQESTSIITEASSAFIFLKSTFTVYATADTRTVYQTVKPAPITITSVVDKVKTKTVTSTLTCIPTAAANVQRLARRQAATITVTQYTTTIIITQTVTSTPPAATVTAELTISDVEVATTTTTPPAAATTITSVSTQSTTSTIPGSTSMTTSTAFTTFITSTTAPVSEVTTSVTTTVISYTKTLTNTVVVKPVLTITTTLDGKTVTKVSTSTSTEEVVVTVTQKGATTCTA